jgi:hypothetical protein
MANALHALAPDGSAASQYLERLDALKKSSPDGGQVWWELEPNSSTAFYGSGRAGNVEATAAAVLALQNGSEDVNSSTSTSAPNRRAGTIQAALNWLTSQRDPNGVWHSTQATVLALKALIAGSEQPASDDQSRTVELSLDGRSVEVLVVPPRQGDVGSQFSITKFITRPGQVLTLAETRGKPTGYQVTWSYRVPHRPSTQPQPLSIAVTYDRTSLAVEETLTATATAANRTDRDAPMVIVELPIPAGFRLETSSLEQLRQAGHVAKYQMAAGSAVLYLRNLPAGQTLVLPYQLRATMPVKLTVSPPAIYEYYNPDRRAAGNPAELVVAPRMQ